MIPKFRTYFKKDDVMTSVDTISFLQGGIKVSDGCWHDEFLSDDVILMQSTGMKDSSDKEIYEGDIVKWKAPLGYSGTGEVIKDGYRFNIRGFFAGCYDIPDSAFSEGAEKFKIVGNIYEDKDLLKVQE